jgi:predicted nucleic acid-binding protein
MILLDTGPVVALCNPLDSLRARAEKDFGQLLGSPFHICEAVLIEACHHLHAGWQRERLGALLADLDVTVRKETNEPVFLGELFAWLEKYADHSPDWADACIAVLSGRDRKLKIWTYDSEFQTTWRRPDGSAIPLAVKRQIS